MSSRARCTKLGYTYLIDATTHFVMCKYSYKSVFRKVKPGLFRYIVTSKKTLHKERLKWFLSRLTDMFL